VGSQIQVELFPPRSTELVRVSGIVRHRALYLYGIEFLVDSEQRSGRWVDVGTIPHRQDLHVSELATDPKHPH
jgi:hypothetical protein